MKYDAGIDSYSKEVYDERKRNIRVQRGYRIFLKQHRFDSTVSLRVKKPPRRDGFFTRRLVPDTVTIKKAGSEVKNQEIFHEEKVS